MGDNFSRRETRKSFRDRPRTLMRTGQALLATSSAATTMAGPLDPLSKRPLAQEVTLPDLVDLHKEEAVRQERRKNNSLFKAVVFVVRMQRAVRQVIKPAQSDDDEQKETNDSVETMHRTAIRQLSKKHRSKSLTSRVAQDNDSHSSTGDTPPNGGSRGSFNFGFGGMLSRQSSMIRSRASNLYRHGTHSKRMPLAKLFRSRPGSDTRKSYKNTTTSYRRDSGGLTLTECERIVPPAATTTVLTPTSPLATGLVPYSTQAPRAKTVHFACMSKAYTMSNADVGYDGSAIAIGLDTALRVATPINAQRRVHLTKQASTEANNTFGEQLCPPHQHMYLQNSKSNSRLTAGSMTVKYGGRMAQSLMSRRQSMKDGLLAAAATLDLHRRNSQEKLSSPSKACSVSPARASLTRGQTLQEQPLNESDSPSTIMPTNNYFGDNHVPPAMTLKSPKPPIVGKRKSHKLYKENVKEVLEIFMAVEQDNIGQVRMSLSKSNVDVNVENLDELTLLDIAVMLSHQETARLLLQHGARENSKLPTMYVRLRKLRDIIEHAQTRLAEFQASKVKDNACKDVDKQLSYWDSRVHMYTMMLKAMNVLGVPPTAPSTSATLHVTSATALHATIHVNKHAERHEAVVTTKYRVDWSRSSDFSTIDGSIQVDDLRHLTVIIGGLTPNVPYFVRYAAGNYAGFGEPQPTEPPSAVPSSWRNAATAVTQSMEASGQRGLIDLYHDVCRVRQTDEWITMFPNERSGLKKKKASLRNLFSMGNRFQRSLKRGVYMASILYNGDRLLITNDDNIPVILVDTNERGVTPADIQWLMKLSCTWDDGLGWLDACHSVADTSLVTSNGTLAMRSSLLLAARTMRAECGSSHLGRLHSKPIVDGNGSTLLITVHYVHDTKAVQGVAVKWGSIAKLLKKRSPSTVPLVQSTSSLSLNTIGTSTSVETAPSTYSSNAMEMLMTGLLDILNFHESTYVPLDRGLYLCYVKMHSSMSDIQVVVPENLPSVLPFVYVRDNPHVCKEEWEWLRSLGDPESKAKATTTQIAFHVSLQSAARVLLTDLDIDAEHIEEHRLYTQEVIEVHPDVSFLLLVPSVNDVCSAPGQSFQPDERRACFTVPLNVFEMTHLCTYQPAFISIYCRLCTFIEHVVVLVAQMQRQCLDTDMSSTSLPSIVDSVQQVKVDYREQLAILTRFQARLEKIWRGMRWISDVVSVARDNRRSDSLATLPLYTLNEYEHYAPSTSTIPTCTVDNVSTSSGSTAHGDIGYHSDISKGQSHEFDIVTIGIGGDSSDTSITTTSTINDVESDVMEENRQDHMSIIDQLYAEIQATAREQTPTPPRDRKITGRRRASAAPSMMTSTDTAQLMKIATSRSPLPAQLAEEEPVVEVPPTVEPTVTTGIVRIYAAYNTGLTRSTSVKLQITSKTTALQITAIVQKQLFELAIEQNCHITLPLLTDHCLVVVVGARERCLRDDYTPLSLAVPWSRGRLCVRRKNNLLAALQHGNEALV